MEKYKISFSGGRTSAYMTKKILDNWKGRYEFIVTFANTGLEHPKTLEFVNNCDKFFGFNTVWLEAVVHHSERKSSTHKVVTFETAARNGEPFEDVIRKYGIPNQATPICTRELKLNPMNSYLRSLGISPNKIKTAIGIRSDETRRVNPKTAASLNLEYPLIDVWPTDKQEVLDWWEGQEFDLGIEEFEGNCLGCFKKTLKKHFLQIDKDPSVYDFHRRMEKEHGYRCTKQGERVFFRKNTSTETLFKLRAEAGDMRVNKTVDEAGNSGCSESCEIFETLINDLR